MKKIVLFRHGKTEAHHSSGDFFRELTHRGFEQVPLMSKKLAETGLISDAIFTSPASRAIQTADMIASTFGIDKHKIIIEKSLYLCDAPHLLSFVRNLPEQFESVVIVGHNNGLTDFINMYSEIRLDNLPTSGYAMLVHEGLLWSDSFQNFKFNGLVNYPSLI